MPKRITENPSFASTSEVLKKAIEHISLSIYLAEIFVLQHGFVLLKHKLVSNLMLSK